MNRIENIAEPRRLWVIWRAHGSGQLQTPRRLVAEIVCEAEPSNATLNYFKDSTDYRAAELEGFQGHTAFARVKQEPHNEMVLQAFLRRLPPRNREDFQDYAERHRLPVESSYSDMALLGYTGAKLPGDGFELVADLRDAQPPFEVLIEVAGFRYQDGVDVAAIHLGDSVSFQLEPGNPHDENAVAINWAGKRIGYVSRGHNLSVLEWIQKGYSITANIERKNGQPERPLIYIFIAVR